MSASNKDLIERFCDTLWLQDGLSANTLEAYRRDLEGLERWFSKRGTALASASRADILEYLSSSVSKGARPRTTARLLSSLRRFYGYLVREEKIKTDPTALIDSPKLGRAPAQIADRRAGGKIAGIAGCRKASRPARPRHAGNALRHRPARFGTGGPDAVAGEPRRRAWCASSARATRNGWCRWEKRRCRGSAVIWPKAGRSWSEAAQLMPCSPPPAAAP